MKEKEVLKVTHSCPLSCSSWPKHHIYRIFSGCHKDMENVDSLQLFGKGDDSPPQQPSIACRRGEEESYSGGTLCHYEVSRRREGFFPGGDVCAILVFSPRSGDVTLRAPVE